ncbi:MAG: NERD domain-containing protein [Anaerolineales bacterium]|nr:NERD domain-containing protein [Anaerolineales bacterium]
MKSKNKKSPLKSAPLRNPGQSLDEQINDLMEDAVTKYFFLITGYLILAVIDWMRWFGFTSNHPIFSTIVFFVVLIYCGYKLYGIYKQLKQLNLARDGEKVVGQYLDDLRSEGARVLHDIVGDKFNIDHVIFSVHGLFVVETKTFQKPAKGNAIIRSDNTNVYVNNFPIERNPIIQGKALSKWLQEVLEKSTGKKFPIQPVVVFPGWFVEKMRGHEEVWILNPKALPTFIRNSPKKLSVDDVHLAFYHLSLYVRALQNK